MNRPLVQCLGGDICKRYCLTGIPEPLSPADLAPYKTKYAEDTSECCCYMYSLGLYNTSPLSYWIIYIVFFYLLSHHIPRRIGGCYEMAKGT